MNDHLIKHSQKYRGLLGVEYNHHWVQHRVLHVLCLAHTGPTDRVICSMTMQVQSPLVNNSNTFSCMTASLRDTFCCASLHWRLNTLHAHLTFSQWSNVCGRAVCFTMLSASMEHGSTGQAAESTYCHALFYLLYPQCNFNWAPIFT